MFSILKIGGSLDGYLQDSEGRYIEFVADAEDDIATLPTGNGDGVKPRPGSMAVCIATGSLYILSNTREWGILVEGRSQ